jgi:cation-transporting ATPase I
MFGRIQSMMSLCRDLATAAVRAGAGTVAGLGPVREQRRVWSRAGHAAIEVRGLTSGQHGTAPGRPGRLADGVRRAVSGLRGVRWAEINAVTGQVLVAFDEKHVDVGTLVETVRRVEAEQGTGGEGFSWSAAHPSDSAPLTANWTALAADVVGVGAGIAGRFGRVAPLPAAVRVPLTVLDGYPRLRGELEKRIGPVAADVLLAVGNGVVYGLSDGPSRPMVDAIYRLLVAGELRAGMSAWTSRCGELAASPETSAAPAADDGGRPCPLPAGPIETYSDRIAAGSLAAAAGVLAATRDAGRAAEALNATVPKAAQLGREGFAAVLGRDLARRGAVPMDRSVFRRLDRVSVAVIDSRVLIGDRPQVLSVTAADQPPRSGADGASADTTVWQAASVVLHGLSVRDLCGPGPWRDEGYQLTRLPVQDGSEPRGASLDVPHPAGSHPAGPHPVGPHSAGMDGPDSPDGLRLRVAGPGGDLGEVMVGCEPDPLAEAVLAAARREGAQLHITRHVSLADLTGRADEVVRGDLAEHVRGLQAESQGVLLVAAGDNAALAAADVAVGYLRDGANQQVGWAGDVICGPGLDQVWRLLRAAGQARPVSERAVALAAGGATLGVLEAAVSQRGGAISSLSPVRIPRLPVSPAQAMSLTGLTLGAYSARALGREESPAPARRMAWHAMSADEVLRRLEADRAGEPQAGRAGEPQPGPDGQDRAGWRGRLDELASPPLAVPVVASARGGADLARAVLSELRDPLTPVLLIGSAASAMLGSTVDAGLVGGVMVGNAVVSGAQRLRTERALRHLLLGQQRCGRRLRREIGQPVPENPDEAAMDLVPATELRPGDIIVLRPDDVVPADARLLAAESLEVDESALTGESLPVAKDPAATVAAHIAERTSMVYDGTTVVSGSAVAVVVAVGDSTEAGRAAAVAAGQSGTAGGVTARLNELTSKALPATGAGGLAVTALGLLRGVPVREALSAGVAVAVAAVPEGLPLVATVAQLAAARRLSRSGVLVRSPRALEALGRVDVVCFDKTGTLTQGRLEVAALASPDDRDLDLDGDQGRRLLRMAARACPPPGARVTHATDQAILDAGAELTPDRWELIAEVPFQNNRGYSAALGRDGGRQVLIVKGAPEVLLAKCSAIAPDAGRAAEVAAEVADDGARAESLTDDRRRRAEAAIARLAGRGLRVLAIARATVGDQGAGEQAASDQGAGVTDTERIVALVRDLTLCGFVAIADVLRPDAQDVVKELAAAGARPVMITGDHPETASAIADGAGIPDAGAVVTGADLDGIAERERLRRVRDGSVFARVTPEQKLRIVADLRRAGHVVAMVGDGANDAAAIRLADVGIGVMARGSTAARSSSDLVLTEGDITRIGDAIAEGRALWRSVSDAVSILVGGNAGELGFMVLGTALGGRSPLNTRQLLLVNMLTDMFPALAVAGTRAAGDGGAAPVSSAPVSSAPLLTGPLGRDIAVRGGATAMGATLAWAGGRLTGRARRASTMGLAAVVGTQLAQTLITGGRSPAVIATSAASAGALVLVVNTPGISQFFGCTPLGPVAWGIVGASTAAATAASLAAPRLLPDSQPGTVRDK